MTDDITGPLYYLYLIMVPTFTTNAINILAGINGVEAIQALVIACSILLNDLLFLPIWPRSFLIALGEVGNPHEGRLLHWAAGEVVKRHLMSSYFMIPLVGGILGFLWHNWWVKRFMVALSSSLARRYPARAFPWRHVLLFHRHGFLCRRNSRALFEDPHTVLHSSNLQLCALVPSAVPPGPLSSPPSTKVSITVCVPDLD